MAKTYSNEMTAELAGNHVIASVANGRLRRRRATVDLAAQASGDQIGLCAIGEGEYFVCGFLTASATLGTAALPASGVLIVDIITAGV